MFSGYITIKEAAQLRGVGYTAIQNLAAAGKIKSKTFYGRRFVLRADVVNYSKKRGRPRKSSMKTPKPVKREQAAA